MKERFPNMSYLNLLRGAPTTKRQIEEENANVMPAVDIMLKSGKIAGQFDLDGELHLFLVKK